MAMKGLESALTSMMAEAIQKKMMAAGKNALEPAPIQALAAGISETIIQFLLTNGQVAPGILVSTAAGAGATTGPGTLI